MGLRRYFLGDACICWSFGEKISSQISRWVLRVFRELSLVGENKASGIRDLVPSYTALAIHFDPAVCSPEDLVEWVEPVIHRLSEADENRDFATGFTHHLLPVLYNGEDLDRVARLNGLSAHEVARRHSGVRYTVAMIGFQPYFPYLIGLDPTLETPRLDSPRTSIPAGAVAIGGAQTGVYPSESPGGWNLIGLTIPKMLKAIEPGDTITFKQVDSL